MSYVVVLKPENAFIELVQVSDEIKLEEMYKLIDCRCVTFLGMDKRAKQAAKVNFHKESVEFINKHDICLIGDDEALLVDKPIVNYVASMMYNSTVCGNFIVAQNVYNKDNEIETKGFTYSEAITLAGVCTQFKILGRAMGVKLDVPTPKAEFKSFNSHEEMLEFMASLQR